MTADISCDVCVGSGDYPIINAKGRELYSIRCPECYGSGKAEIEDTPIDDPTLPPASSAARIHTMADLREHIVQHWASTPLPQQQNTTQEKT